MKKLTKQLDWNLLRTFVVIVEAKSVSRAAEFLARGQPAISAALNRLERVLRIKLATRSASGFTLTPSGKLLYREAKGIVGEIDRLTTMMDDLENDLSGTVRLTMASQTTSPLIDEAIAKFHRDYPKAKFDISTIGSSDIVDAISGGQVYFGIAPVYSKRKDLEYFLIFTEFCGFYCGPAHPLFGKSGLSTKDLVGKNAVSFKSDIYSDALQSISNKRVEMSFSEPIVGVSTYMHEVRRMIIAGLGIGAIPIHIAERDVTDGLLWRLPPYELTMPIEVYLITNPKIDPIQTELKFVETLKKIVSSMDIESRTYPESLKSAKKVKKSKPRKI
jgi:DNA-binding transcriptional LysR family regulator